MFVTLTTPLSCLLLCSTESQEQQTAIWPQQVILTIWGLSLLICQMIGLNTSLFSNRGILKRPKKIHFKTDMPIRPSSLKTEFSNKPIFYDGLYSQLCGPWEVKLCVCKFALLSVKSTEGAIPVTPDRLKTEAPVTAQAPGPFQSRFFL